jgi:ribosomal protein S3AE
MTTHNLKEAYEAILDVDATVREETEINKLSECLRQFSIMEKMIGVILKKVAENSTPDFGLLAMQEKIKASMLTCTEKIYSLITLKTVVQ